MATGNRTLKLSILADIDSLKKNLNAGEKEVEGFGGKLEKFSKAAGAAFLAAGAAAAAYAGKLAVEGVKAAIEDEAAQKRLATALQNVTGATEAQPTSPRYEKLKEISINTTYNITGTNLTIGEELFMLISFRAHIVTGKQIGRASCRERV